MFGEIKSAMVSMLKPFNFALWVILIVVLTLAGPFGTFETVSFGWRLVYWGLVVVISATFGYQVTYIARYFTKRRHPLVTDLLATVLMTLLFSPVNLYLTNTFVSTATLTYPSLIEMMAYVAWITFAILTGRRLIPGIEDNNYLPKTHDINQPRLMRRLPECEQGRILRISSQGHFVDVVTDAGSTRLRMRLADAIDEMDGVGGYWTHRSHWVAESAISEIAKEGGKLLVQLSNGDMVPISRKYKPDMERAGLI